jgi:hypothetical protein
MPLQEMKGLFSLHFEGKEQDRRYVYEGYQMHLCLNAYLDLFRISDRIRDEPLAVNSEQY